MISFVWEREPRNEARVRREHGPGAHFCLFAFLKMSHLKICFHNSGNDPVKCERREIAEVKSLSR